MTRRTREVLSQGEASTMQPNPNRTFPQPCHFGDFGGLEALHIMQHNDESVLRRYFLQRCSKVLSSFVAKHG